MFQKILKKWSRTWRRFQRVDVLVLLPHVIYAHLMKFVNLMVVLICISDCKCLDVKFWIPSQTNLAHLQVANVLVELFLVHAVRQTEAHIKIMGRICHLSISMTFWMIPWAIKIPQAYLQVIVFTFFWSSWSRLHEYLQRMLIIQFLVALMSNHQLLHLMLV